jgi:hypothetical protein
MSHNSWTNNTIGLKWFLKCFLSKSKSTLYNKYQIMVFDRHTSYISSDVIQACVANKVILLCLPSYITHLLQPFDIRLFAPLFVYYKNDIQANTQFGYNNSVNKLVFL